ncbi:hypothetical protein EB796_022881 [Bugula neritina]|uniref:Uncharacterized protein n=1 Tax=Bugula neritina TaxID=10212 RepID=A0A7J7IY31_BUGNE|nr:hypothetical protein EB796_022881 [Bugula neritina]
MRKMADHFAVFVLGLLAVFAVSLFTLYSYSNIRKQHVIVTVATLIAWYSSFIIVFILPLDISATKYKQCQKDHNCSLENSNNPRNRSSPWILSKHDNCVEPIFMSVCRALVMGSPNCALGVLEDCLLGCTSSYMASFTNNEFLCQCRRVYCDWQTEVGYYS